MGLGGLTYMSETRDEGGLLIIATDQSYYLISKLISDLNI
jgi:hypothetical protein